MFDRLCSVLASVGLVISVPDSWAVPTAFAVIFLIFNTSASMEEFFARKDRQLAQRQK